MMVEYTTPGGTEKKVNADLITRISRRRMTVVTNKEAHETMSIEVSNLIRVSGHFKVNMEGPGKLPESFEVQGGEIENAGSTMSPWFVVYNGTKFNIDAVSSMIDIKVCPGCGIHSTHADFGAVKCVECES